MFMPKRTRTHIHTYIYIYVYIHTCTALPRSGARNTSSCCKRSLVETSMGRVKYSGHISRTLRIFIDNQYTVISLEYQWNIHGIWMHLGNMHRYPMEYQQNINGMPMANHSDQQHGHIGVPVIVGIPQRAHFAKTL